jgi:hypothetical protein
VHDLAEESAQSQHLPEGRSCELTHKSVVHLEIKQRAKLAFTVQKSALVLKIAVDVLQIRQTTARLSSLVAH